MGGTQFFALFHSLDKKEFVAFGKYLRWAHANKKIALETFGHLAKSHPVHGNRKAWEESRLAEKLFGTAHKEMALKQLHNTYHDLYLCLRDFLILQKANDDSMESEWLWLAVLRHRNKKAYEKAAVRFFSKLESAPKQDTMDYLWDATFRYQAYAGQAQPDEKKLQELSHALDECYTVCRNKIDCEILNRERQRGNMGKRQSEAPSGGSPAKLAVYERIRQLFKSNDDQLFRDVLNDMYQLPAHISKGELKAVWTYLKNHCAERIRHGKPDFLFYAHVLDKFASGQLFFLNEGERLSALQFLNVVSAALTTGELDWARDFTTTRITLLEKATQGEVKILAEAMILFKAGKFMQARHVLESFDEDWSGDESIAIRRRAYALMCMYECGEDSELLDRSLNSFYRFLQRSNSPRQASVRGARNFLLFFNHLMGRKRPKTKLEAGIKAANPCAFKNWLLLKIKDYSPIG